MTLTFLSFAAISPQDGHGAVLRGVVDEDVLVAVAADFLEDFFDLLVAFADVFLLVVAAADDADELASRRRGGSGEGAMQAEGCSKV